MSTKKHKWATDTERERQMYDMVSNYSRLQYEKFLKEQEKKSFMDYLKNKLFFWVH